MVEKGIREEICHAIHRYASSLQMTLNGLKIFLNLMEKLHELRNDLPLLPERMKIEKVEKLVTNSYDKTEYVIHIRNSKQELDHGLVFLVLKKVHIIIKFNQKTQV